jgi:hypothetical protein
MTMAGVMGGAAYQNTVKLILKVLYTILQFHFSCLKLENSKFQLRPFDPFLAYVVGSTDDLPPLLP